nr:MAG TPA: hypothetical protein [Herelleviridae sp.]DAM33916.1 MAG TPA: hypothetical protein [Caudoviricetes sp.]
MTKALLLEVLTITDKKFRQPSAWRNVRNLYKQSVRKNVENRP